MAPKDKSKLVLGRLFPHVDFRATPRCGKPHEGLMDALFIAEYGRRVEIPKIAKIEEESQGEIETIIKE